MRYKFYREHKYVCGAINDVERLIAKTDFSSEAQVQKVKDSFDDLVQMLKGHAHYENGYSKKEALRFISTLKKSISNMSSSYKIWLIDLIVLF